MIKIRFGEDAAVDLVAVFLLIALGVLAVFVFGSVNTFVSVVVVVGGAIVFGIVWTVVVCFVWFVAEFLVGVAGRIWND